MAHRRNKGKKEDRKNKKSRKEEARRALIEKRAKKKHSDSFGSAEFRPLLNRQNRSLFIPPMTLGRRHLEVSIDKYTSFYNERRNHQGVENKLLTPREFAEDGPIKCQSQLGGMLNFYYRKAA